MAENRLFPPEGFRPPVPYTTEILREAVQTQSVLEGIVWRCDTKQTLHLSLGGVSGYIPREEAVAPWISGADRDISVLSRVGKYTCFTVKDVFPDEKGAPVALLSRRKAQEDAMEWFLENLKPGMVLNCCVTRLESFGVFADIGCGIIAMLPIEHISVSRISHPKERFQRGQKFLAVVRSFDKARRRITLTHRELLGTWMENASRFCPGETVQGIVRSVKEYGSFIELLPNLSGLADLREDISPGDAVSVYIKSIQPERMKIKLQIIEKLPEGATLLPMHYQITDGYLEHWVYSPANYELKAVETDFTTHTV